MATIPSLSIARLIMQLVKTDQVAQLQDYSNVELADVDVAIKFADAFWNFNGPQLYEQDGETPRDPTNEEKAIHYRREIRQFHRDRLFATRVPPAGRNAENAERELVEAEVNAALGK